MAPSTRSPVTRETEPAADPVDEFDWIRRCLMPLAADAPESLGLADDAALIAARPGWDLVVSKDAMVEGVHFLPDDPLDGVARKLLRANLSDLAAKGAEPYGYFLAVAWPKGCGWARREAFARGLAEDQARFGLKLFGGDTVTASGGLTLSLTILGWVPAGEMVRRCGARPGQVVLVSGTIGDAVLGLEAAQGGLSTLSTADREALADRYRRPRPRLEAAVALRRWACATADVSDGLVADAGHIAEASGVRIELDLDQSPLSPATSAWLEAQPDRALALVRLATGGDDYELVCTADPDAADRLIADCAARGLPMRVIGRVAEGQGVEVRCHGALVAVGQAGYRHG